MNYKLRTQLRLKHTAVNRALEDVGRRKAELNELIQAAVADGATAQDLADALGVSRSRAWEMIRQADGRGRSGRKVRS